MVFSKGAPTSSRLPTRCPVSRSSARDILSKI
jgi:hypothetical protein